MPLLMSPVIAGGGSGGGGDVTAASNIADNSIVRGDGGAKGIQESNHTISDSGNVVFTQSVITTGSPTFITVNPGAHTTLTSAEDTDIDFALDRTVEFATGNFALQRAVRFRGPIYAAVGASIISKAATVSIAPPTAGANMTITDKYSLRLTGSLEMAGAPAVIQVTDTDLGLTIRGNRASAGLAGQLTVDSVVATTPLVRSLVLSEAGTERNLFFAHGGMQITQSSESTADIKLFTATPGTYTGQTASTEIQNFSIATYSRTWATGAITNQREFVLNAPTYAFAGASTITNAATFYISGAPIAGANATLTNTYALWVDSGVARFDGLTVGGTAGFTDITASSITVNNTGLHVLDTDASHDLIIAPGSNLSADRTLTLTTGNSDRTVTISGNATISQDYSTSGAPAFARIGIGAPADAVTTEVVTQAVASSGSPNIMVVTGAAHTTLAASTEATDVGFNLARTVQFATGALTLQRAFRIQGPTYAFVGASTLTTAVTLDVDKPVAGTNATLTNIRAIRSNGILEVNNGAATSQIIISGGTTSVADIEVTTTATGLRLIGNIAASTSTSTVADVNVVPNATRTAGNVFRVSNASSNRFSINYQGTALACETATTGGTAASYRAANPNHTGQTASTEINNWQSPAYTRTWATGAITTQREVLFAQLTIAFAGASTVTTATGMELISPTAGTNATITNLYALNLGGDATVGASAAGTSYRALRVPAHTLTLTGTTQVTTTCAVAAAALNIITITDASAVTVDAAATLYVAGAPLAAGSVTLTNPYSIWVDAGTTRLDGLLDLSNISAGSPNIKITATSDTPGTTWNVVGTNNPSAAPSGFLELDVGGNARYIPFYA